MHNHLSYGGTSFILFLSAVAGNGANQVFLSRRVCIFAKAEFLAKLDLPAAEPALGCRSAIGRTAGNGDYRVENRSASEVERPGKSKD